MTIEYKNERNRIIDECIKAICHRCEKGDPIIEGSHYSQTTKDLDVRTEIVRYNYRECPAEPLRKLYAK